MGYLYSIYEYTGRGQQLASVDEGTDSYVEREGPGMCSGRTKHVVAIVRSGAPASLEVIVCSAAGVVFRGSIDAWHEIKTRVLTGREPDDYEDD